MDKSEANKRTKIPGGYDDEANILYIARNKKGDTRGNYQYCGVIYGDKCNIYINTKYYELDDYEVLVQKLYEKAT